MSDTADLATRLAEVTDSIAADLARGIGGDLLSRRYADVVATVVSRLLAARCSPGDDSMVVLAQGGLARRQLVIGADVDVLFVLRDNDDPEARAAWLGAIIADLWDLGLKVSWAVRRENELRGLFDDVDGKAGHAAMALMEARPLGGDLERGWEVLSTLRRGLGHERRRRLLRARLYEALRRRARFFSSPAMVEPSLKDGPGGLREVHLITWAGLLLSGLDLQHAQRHRQRPWPPQDSERSPTIDDDEPPLADERDGEAWRDDPLFALLRAGTLYPSEVRTLAAARSTLQRLRWALALSSNGQEQRLHAAAAEVAAPFLGDHINDGLEHIVDVAGPLRPGEAMVRAATHVMRRCLVVVDDALHRLGQKDLPLPPVRPTRPSTAPELLALLSQPDAHTVPGPLTGLLERGLLQPLVPDLARLEGRVKHDGIHAFCTDAHLARCGDIALAIVGGNDEHLGPLALPPPMLPVLRRLERPAVVVAGALFHDIGKGLPGDHSEVGEAIARTELTRLGFDDDVVEDVAFIVKHHLLLSVTAQRADLGDPRVIDDITAIIDTPERLDALAIVTWCDWCAVGPGVGTVWKGRLLADCVDAVREALLSPTTQARDADAVRRRASDYLSLLDSIVDDDIRQRFVADASIPWLRGRTREALQYDLRAFATLESAPLEHGAHGQGAFVDATQSTPQRAWVLGADRPGLLADLAAAFTAEGINVLDARLDVRIDGRAFDCFVFDDGKGGVVPPETCRLLQAALHDALGGQTRPVTRRRFDNRTATAVSPRVRYLESSADRLVIEVRCLNRRGLLHDLAQVIAEHGLSISLARLHTEGQRVTDVFTARPAAGRIDVDERGVRGGAENGPEDDEAFRARLATALLRVAEG